MEEPGKKRGAKEARRAAEERKAAELARAKLRRNLIAGALVLAAAVLVVGLVVSRKPGSSPAGSQPVPTLTGSGCTPVQTYPIEGRTHVPPGTRVDYGTDPPTSGNHWPTPADPGFYSQAVPSEQLVHNLEHGQIVFWYKSSAPSSITAGLKQVVGQDIALVAAPYDYQGPGEFAMTAWGAAQYCNDISQEAIDAFRTQFQGKGPELVVPKFKG
jgi:hypothetical protein